MIFYIAILFSFLFCQVKPYQEPLFVHNNNTDRIDTISSYENQFIIKQKDGLKHYEIEADNQELYEIIISTKNIIDDFTIFFIDSNSKSFMGPYKKNDIYNHKIISNPINYKSIIIEILIETESSIENEFAFSINRHENKKINNKTTNYSIRNNPIILVTGYWPPTNEMIRHFSQSNELNPTGWEGENWENRGYDIISYFPTFDNPDCSNCGQGNGILQVDYQNTSNDFWPIVEEHRPIAIITFSRGYIDQSWELEYNAYNRMNWYNDYSSPFQPTPNPPDENEATYFLRNSNLPMDNIVEAINMLNIGLNPYIDSNGDPGSFVSEFMAYHGTWYRDINQSGDNNCLSAGHVHVGANIDWDTAKIATEETIRTLINYVDQFVYIAGDANLDEVIDVLDLVVIINHILGNSLLSDVGFYASDINQDGIINIQDIILLINIILNN